MLKNRKIMKMTITAFMAAIISILAPISIPLLFGAVPVSLGTFAVYLSAGILGEKLGSLSVLIYLLIGIMGLPVFAGWNAGASVISGPTGGYLFGYIIIAYCTGWFAHRFKEKLIYIMVGMVLGTLGCYILGTVWLSWQLSMSASEAILAGVLPFVVGDILKIIISLIIIKPIVKQIDIIGI